MWNDIETTEDLLNFQVVADTAAQIIRDSNNQPISIGVSGSWGVGKSSLSKMIVKSIKSNEDKQKYVIIEFDAWLYQGYDDAKLALLQIVSDKLFLESKKNESALSKAKEFAKRINWLRMGKLLAPVVGGAVTGGSLGGPVGVVIGAVGGIVKSGGTPTSDDLKNLRDAYSNLGPEISGLLKEQSSTSIPKEISELRQVFSDLLEELDVKLIIVVDDLDRCLPYTAISTLEAIRLLLFLQNTAFIVAADEEMIRNAVKVHFGDEDMSKDLVTSYFDKLIQVPIHVPRLGTTEIKAYLILLLAETKMQSGVITDECFLDAKKKILKAVKLSWSKELTFGIMMESFGDEAKNIQTEIELADQIAGIMVNSKHILGNPRLIKRFLNDLMIKRTIGEAQGLTISFEEQVKMQLFERCATEKAFEFLIQNISVVDGKIAFLKELEDKIAEGGEISLPDPSWDDNFIKGWLELKPNLGDTDLRPLVYLSREKSLSMQNSDDLSPEGKQILAILEASSKFDDTLVPRIKKIGEVEASRLFVRMKKIIRSNQWNQKYFIQSMHIPTAFQSISIQFISFVNEMPPEKRIPALIPQLVRTEWGLSLVEVWKNDKDTPERTIKAIKGFRR